MNKVHLVGRLGADPELKGKDNNVCRMRIATDERRKVGDEWENYAEWHTVTAFGSVGQNCAKYLTKGRTIAVIGRLSTNQWEDKTGNTRYEVQILAEDIEFLGGAGDGN